MGAAAMGVVDYWCNAFTPDRAERWESALAAQGVPLKVRGERGDTFCEPGAMVARMDELGIGTLVLPACDPHHPDDPHDFSVVAALSPDESHDLARTGPGRFAAMWSFDPTGGWRSVERAEEALSWAHVVALHLHTHSFDRPFDHRDLYPFYVLAAQHGVPVVVQAGTSGGLLPSECGRPIGIDRPAIAFDTVDFVLSHTGWPWVGEAIAMALKFPNVWLGTAVYPRRHWPEELGSFLRGPGRRSMLYGSGFPAAGHRHTLGQLAEADLDPATEAAYLGGNARGLFKRLQPNATGASGG